MIKFGEIDEAYDYLDESRQADLDAEKSWDLQTLTARCAKALGFRGVAVRDEQGTSYMIEMVERESDLVLL